MTQRDTSSDVAAQALRAGDEHTAGQQSFWRGEPLTGWPDTAFGQGWIAGALEAQRTLVEYGGLIKAGPSVQAAFKKVRETIRALRPDNNGGDGGMPIQWRLMTEAERAMKDAEAALAEGRAEDAARAGSTGARP